MRRDGGSQERHALIVFGRIPEPGRVKTRLGETIGFVEAAALYRAFLHDSLTAFRSGKYTTRLYLDKKPDQSGDLALDAETVSTICLQKGEGLGQRMANAIQETLELGYSGVCLVGSDHPTLPPRRIELAFSHLQSHRLVLGPTTDGGYYLLGCREPHRDLLEDVAYSQPDTLTSTIKRARAFGIDPVILDPWYDIDVADDLYRLVDDVSKSRGVAIRTRSTLKKFGLM